MQVRLNLLSSLLKKKLANATSHPTRSEAMSVASATASKSPNDSVAPAPVIELPVGELDMLIARVEQAEQARLRH